MGCEMTRRDWILTGVGAAASGGLSPRTLIAVQTAAAPEWFRDLMTALVADGDEWMADNTAYRSDQEPVDVYVLKWTWGPGRRSISGRLQAIVGADRRPPLWEFRQFWHPDRREGRLVQYGTDGTVGEGALARDADGGIIVEQDFWNPNGQSWRQRHEERATPRARESRDARWVNGTWREGRRYAWARRVAAARPVPREAWPDRSR